MDNVLMSNITIVNHMLDKAKGMGFVLPSQTEMWQADSPLCQHLEGADKAHLDITGCQRVPDSLSRETCTGKEAKSAFLLYRAAGSGTGGGHLSSGQGGSDSSRQQGEFYSILFWFPRRMGK